MNGIPMKFDYSKTLNEQLSTFNYYKDRYMCYELELLRLREENQHLKKQKSDVVEYIKKHKHLNWYVESCYTDDLLRMLGEIDVEDN